MAKKPTVTTVSSGFASNTQLNNNFTALRDAFDNTLSLDGSTPNAMQADLDLNGNDILNAGVVNADNVVVDGVNLTTQVANAASSASSAAASASAASLYAPAYFDNVADLLADTTSWPTGQILNTREEGFAYQVAASGASDHHVTTAGGVKLYVIADAAARVFADSFGLVGDDSTDDAAAFNAAMSYLESRGGGEFHFNGSKTYRMTAVTQASNTRVYLNGATVKVHPSTPKTGNWWTNRNINALSGDRTCNDTHIIGPGTLDGSLRPFDRWLSTSSGTPITDPEADYVAGTGALASGITGVSLTAVLTSDVVTSVTVNTGGSGWNGHPTFPYIPTTVPLKFTGGGGSGAKAFATISGGTLIGVTMEEGGSGYTSPPTVTTMGGYADIALLVQPSVNRRNAAYNDAGNGVAFQKVDRPVVSDVLFTGFRCRTLADVGCKDAKFIRCAFEDCGKNDGPFHAIWTQSSGNPTVPPVFYAPSENTLIDACVFNNLERSAIQMAPAKGGVVRNCRMDNCGESTIYINTNANYNGGMIVIEGNTFVGGYVTDIVSYHIEAQATKNLIIRDNDFTGSSEGVLALGGCQNTRVFGNRFEDCSTGASTLAGFIPYGPFSERYGFNAGTRSIAGTANLSNTHALVEVGIIDTVPQAATEFANNVFIETRGVASHARSIFAQVKSGGVSSIAGSTSIHDNDVTQVPATLPFYTTPVGTVWTANMPLSIRNNPGHVSEAPVILEQTITGTGLLAFTPGFRPSMVVLEAVTTNNTLFRYGTGRIVWKRDAIRNDYSMILATDGTNHRALTIGTEAIRLVDTAGTTILGVEFVSWQELGFTLNVITRTTNCTLKMVCIP